MLSPCNNTSCITADTVSFSLSVAFTIVHVIALGVLLFFKMYHKFIYRLLLYAFVALIHVHVTTSISWTTYSLKYKVNKWNLKYLQTAPCTLYFYTFMLAVLTFFYLLQTSTGLCMYILALHHHQFTSWVADLIFLLVCLILSQLIAIPFLVVDHELFLSHPFHKTYCSIFVCSPEFHNDKLQHCLDKIMT